MLSGQINFPRDACIFQREHGGLLDEIERGRGLIYRRILFRYLANADQNRGSRVCHLWVSIFVDIIKDQQASGYQISHRSMKVRSSAGIRVTGPNLPMGQPMGIVTTHHIHRGCKSIDGAHLRKPGAWLLARRLNQLPCTR